MSRADTFTNTEHAAGLYDQATTYEVDDRDHDEPTGPVEHACTSPDPAHCMICVLTIIIAEQKAAGIR